MRTYIANQKRRNTDINKEGTMGFAIKNHIHELNAVHSPLALTSFMKQIEPEVSDKSYFEEVYKNISTTPFSSGYKMLYNIYLKGMGLSESYF